MKHRIALLAMAAVVSAQTQCAASASAIPTCGQPCLISAASAVGCASTDYACACSPAASSTISSLAQNCILSVCGVETGLQVESSAEAVCSCVSSVPPPSTISSAAFVTSIHAAASATESSPSPPSPAPTVSSASATVTSLAVTSGFIIGSSAVGPSIFQSSSITRRPVANSTASKTFTGGQNTVHPAPGLTAAVFAIFCGLIVFL